MLQTMGQTSVNQKVSYIIHSLVPILTHNISLLKSSAEDKSDRTLTINNEEEKKEGTEEPGPNNPTYDVQSTSTSTSKRMILFFM